MVAGKVKAAMGFQRSPATPKLDTPRLHRRHNSTPLSSQKADAAATPPAAPQQKSSGGSTGFTRYFPRSNSAQVQPRPSPKVADLLRLVEELQENESRLRTELLEQKILKETVAVVPFLEKEIALKNDELEISKQKAMALETENQTLKLEVERLQSIIEEMEEERDMEERIEDMESEIEELKRAMAEQSKGGGQSRSHRANGTEEVAEASASAAAPATVAADVCSTTSSPTSSSAQRCQGLIDASSKSNMVKNARTKSSPSTEAVSNPEIPKPSESKGKEAEAEAERRRQEVSESVISALKSRAPRIPRPPPTPSCSSTSSSSSCYSSTSSVSSSETLGSDRRPTALPPTPPPVPLAGLSQGGLPRPPPPPPPPPPAKVFKSAAAKVRRVPEVVEFYHSLMRRDSKRETGSGVPDAPAAANTKDMIGEIENRSAYLLAIKTEVETQGDFIRFLIKEVENAAFTNIEDVVAFVKWLDDELSFLVDERAVLKHFDWPEKKADAMREAAFGYSDLKKLVSEASSFRDDTHQHCSAALKKMQALLEKLEHAVYNLSRTREAAIKRYKGFRIPGEWMLDTGFVAQIKLASVKLAMQYMKRVSAELEAVGGGPEEEELVLQCVRFAFRVHQFAGGFDAETMRAFQELRHKARSCQMQTQEQNHSNQSLARRSTTC